MPKRQIAYILRPTISEVKGSSPIFTKRIIAIETPITIVAIR